MKTMIKNILYVEDGSVDIDELENNLGKETKIVVYRQGSQKPVLIQLREPINLDYTTEMLQSRIDKAVERLESCPGMQMYELHRMVCEVVNILRGSNSTK